MATQQIERTIQNNSKFNHSNIVCESIIPENVHSSKGRPCNQRMRKDKALQQQNQQKQQKQSATAENKELTENNANHEEQTNTNKRKDEKGKNAEQRSTVFIGDSS